MVEPFDCNGLNLCPAVIETFGRLRTRLISRMNAERLKPPGTRSPIFKALRRQLNAVNEIIRIGREPSCPFRLYRIYQLTFINREVYPIPNQ